MEDLILVYISVMLVIGLRLLVDYLYEVHKRQNQDRANEKWWELWQ